MKKGFTLIELLAVIVILAIIALIATPIILEVINNTKQESNKRSIEMYAKAVENAIARYQLDNNNIPLSINQLNIEYDGSEINCNSSINADGTIYLESCEVNGQYVDYTYGKYKIIPDLYDGTLTPVVYKDNNWVVANQTEEWFNYEKQKWANAVILDSNVTKTAGDSLDITTEVLAMLVWIPRYEYKYTNLGANYAGGTKTQPGEIEINFIPKNKTRESTEEYKIHPAFTFGTKDLSGIWVGKFEISHTTLSSSIIDNNLECSTETCINSSGIRVLPNVQSLRYNNMSNFFYGIKSMNMEGNVFGIKSTITDTHMIKNSEWGAVAYLSQSRYGKYGNSNYTGTNKEIYVNNSSLGYTGKSGGSIKVNAKESGSYSYDELIKGTGASTTGNIYGIYDMSGGTWERVMGVFANSEGKLWSGESEENNSGFTGLVGSSGSPYEGIPFPETKYYDVYKASDGKSISITKACNGGICYGHALSETTGWYDDYSNFISSSGPWIHRGGNYNNGSAGNAGIFYYNSSQGYTNSNQGLGNLSTRIVFVSEQ